MPVSMAMPSRMTARWSTPNSAARCTGQAEAATGARVVADIEHRAAAFRVGAVEPVDAAAELPDLVEEAERGKHGQAGRLQDQAGADRRRLVESARRR